MKQANVSTLKNNLSRYLDYVKSGGVVRVFDRDRPVAEIVALGGEENGAPGALAAILADLERQGVVRRGTGAVSAVLLRSPLPTSRRSVVAALLEDRRAGR